MSTLQQFKTNDLLEVKVNECFLPTLDLLGLALNDFNSGAFQCFKLGDVLFVLNRSPLADVITQEVFEQSFPAIHDYFTRPGTFEFYLDIFRKIWGDAVDVEFTVPSPGKLQINIDALDIEETDFLARKIIDDEYTYDEVVDHDGDNIEFQTTKGIKTQAEVDALMRELHPAGVFVETTLTIS